MQEELHEKRKGRIIEIIGVFLPFLPKLLFKFSITFLRFKRGAKKAGKIFRKELIYQGLDKRTASELTGFYMKGSEIKNFIRTFR
jgi:ribosomal protein S16